MPIRSERCRTVPRARGLRGLVVAALLAVSPSAAAFEVALAGGSVDPPRQLLDLSLLDVAADPRANGRLYALTAENRLLRSVDGGESWEETGTAPGGVFAPAGVEDLEIDPLRPDVLYARPRSFDLPLFRSSDAGESWQPAGADSTGLGELAVVGAPAGEVTLVGVGSAQVLRSLDRGETWADLGEISDFEGFGFRPRKPVVAAGRPDLLYVAGTLVSGLPPQLGNPCGSVCVEEHLFRSLDGGATWTALDPPFLEGPGHLRIDPRAPDTLYAVAEGALHRSADRGESWEVASELPGPGGVDLLADPRRAASIYRATFQDGVFHTTDGGKTWRPVAPGFAPVGLRDLAFLDSPTGPDALYAAGQGGLWALEVAPPVPPGPSFADPALAGFRVWVRITGQGGTTLPVRAEPACIPETLCVSGAVPGRSEVFVRIVGPKPNGLLWPTLVKFTTSRVEVWIEQTATGEVEYYELPGAAPGVDELPGRFDREGFEP